MRSPALVGMTRNTLRPEVNLCVTYPIVSGGGEKAYHLLSIELSFQNQQELGVGTMLGKFHPQRLVARTLEAHPLYPRLAKLPRALIYLIKNWKSQGPAGGD